MSGPYHPFGLAWLFVLVGIAGADRDRSHVKASLSISSDSWSGLGIRLQKHETELLRLDQEARANTKYRALTDSLDPFIQDLGTALDDTSRGHYLGVDVPGFSVPLAARETYDRVPYRAFYDMDKQAYRGGKFLSYLSQGPLPQDSYSEVPCGPREKAGDPDPTVVPQNLWDGNAITAWITGQNSKSDPQLTGTSNPRKDLVVMLNFVQAGYWGHMSDNGFSRIAFASEAAQQHGYNLHVLIPREQLVHGLESMHQVQDMVEHVFHGKLVIPTVTKDQLPEHCTDPAQFNSGGAVCRFFMSCGLPSFHQIPRRRFVQLAQTALARYQHANNNAKGENVATAFLQTTPHRVKDKPFVHFARGDGFNSKGDENLSPLLAERLEATGRWDVVRNLASWPLMKVADFVSGHRSTLNIEGSAAYHALWMGLPSDGDEEREMVEIYPDGCTSYDKWLWAHVLGMKHKVFFFDRGTSDVDSIIRQVPELM